MVKEEKIKKVEEIKRLLEGYRVIGLIDMFKFPSKQLQEIRKNVRSEALLKMCKKSLLQIALEKANMKMLIELLPQQPALVFTNLEPFKFYKKISALKSPTFAKEGDIAESDIIVKAGSTNLLPGPVISELSRVGIPAGVEQGKIAIKKGVTVAKKGEKISKELASVLRKLGIQPITISLNIVAIYENGNVYSKDILELVNIYPQKLSEAYNHALNLSINVCYPTKENIKFLLVKAFNNAKALESKFGGAK